MKSNIVVFLLTMPNNNSWNGKWTGADRLYAVVKNLGTSKKSAGRAKVLVGNYYYNFGDGWGANVECKIVDTKEAAKFRKNTKGFCGYDWMIESILLCGQIKV